MGLFLRENANSPGESRILLGGNELYSGKRIFPRQKRVVLGDTRGMSGDNRNQERLGESLGARPVGYCRMLLVPGPEKRPDRDTLDTFLNIFPTFVNISPNIACTAGVLTCLLR